MKPPGLLLLSHGDLAVAARESASEILGDLGDVLALSLKPNQALPAFQDEILRAIEENGPERDWLILVDLFGDPARTSVRSQRRPKEDPILGLNLAMVIDFVLHRGHRPFPNWSKVMARKASTSTSARRRGPDPVKEMLFVRVDDRLIHGQVIMGWVPTSPRRIVVVSAGGLTRSRAAMAMGVPEGRVHVFRPRPRRGDRWPRPYSTLRRRLPVDLLPLAQAGALGPINLGGCATRAGGITSDLFSARGHRSVHELMRGLWSSGG